MAVEGDRVIIGQVAPPDTIGGGVVVDAAPRKHGPSEAVVAALRGEAVAEPEPSAESEPEPEPLDDAALALGALLRSDGASPRADGDLAEAAGIDSRSAARAWTALERAGEAVRLGPSLHF